MSAWVKRKEESDKERLEAAKKKYKKRNFMLELMGGQYYNFEGVLLQKDDGMFLNWLCYSAFEEIKRLRNGRSDVTVPRDGSEAEEAKESR